MVSSLKLENHSFQTYDIIVSALADQLSQKYDFFRDQLSQTYDFFVFVPVAAATSKSYFWDN